MMLQTPKAQQAPTAQPRRGSSSHAIFARLILAHAIFVRATSAPKFSGGIYGSGEAVTLRGRASIRLSTQTPMRIIQFRGQLNHTGFSSQDARRADGPPTETSFGLRFAYRRRLAGAFDVALLTQAISNIQRATRGRFCTTTRYSEVSSPNALRPGKSKVSTAHPGVEE